MSEAREGRSTGEHGDVELPADEVLHVRALTEREPPADLLDVPEDASDLPAPDDDAPIGDHDRDLEQALPRTVLGGDGVETRFEDLDSTEE
jgi:hypothetical protein